MMHGLIMLIVFLGGGAFFWFLIRQPMIAIVTNISTRYASYFTASDIDFITAFDTYVPAMLLIGCLIFLIVRAQRTRPEGYYG